jgi:hypothetical protein
VGNEERRARHRADADRSSSRPSADPEPVKALLAGFETVARTLEALLVEFETVAVRAAEVARSTARMIVEGSLDEDAGTVYIVALEATARELEATASRALSVRTGAQRAEDTPADR